jgi:hypothetical protein
MIERDIMRQLTKPTPPAVMRKGLILIACLLGGTALLYVVFSYLAFGHL